MDGKRAYCRTLWISVTATHTVMCVLVLSILTLRLTRMIAYLLCGPRDFQHGQGKALSYHQISWWAQWAGHSYCSVAFSWLYLTQPRGRFQSCPVTIQYNGRVCEPQCSPMLILLPCWVPFMHTLTIPHRLLESQFFLFHPQMRHQAQVAPTPRQVPHYIPLLLPVLRRPCLSLIALSTYHLATR